MGVEAEEWRAWEWGPQELGVEKRGANEAQKERERDEQIGDMPEGGLQRVMPQEPVRQSGDQGARYMLQNTSKHKTKCWQCLKFEIRTEQVLFFALIVRETHRLMLITP